MAKSSNAGRAQKARPVSQRSRLRGVWENFKSILGALAIFLVLRAFLVEAYRIPSGSMIPTLLVGDWLFVNKAIYGAHVPFSRASLPAYREPKRGDVVVFVSPYQGDEAAQGRDPTPTLVKRLVGTPGDTLHMRNALLYVNGIAQRQGFGVNTAAPDPGMANEVNPLFDWQKKVGLKSSRFGAAPAQPTHDNWGPLVVPPQRLFMMGDSRYNSKDSRYWGFVPRENVRGKPLFVYYSYNADDSDRPLPMLTDIRWSRIGHWIK
ncbi:MAG TPA: signal peptidase I [Gemmatimonadaceae bacterium]|nr:signal peptidase I [Gemmatimonadaceae bacterium]